MTWSITGSASMSEMVPTTVLMPVRASASCQTTWPFS
jgi:hypothetical protein